MLTRQDYIKALGNVLTVKEDFKRLEYYEIHNKEIKKEYLSLHLLTGYVMMFDVTGYSEERIYHTLAMIECGQMPKNFVRDSKELIRIAKIIHKQGAA